MNKLIDGKRMSHDILQALSRVISVARGSGRAGTPVRKPSLAIVQVGNDPASTLYIRNKVRQGQQVGISVQVRRVEVARATTHDMRSLVEELNNDAGVDGIIMQLPLPNHLPPYDLCQVIDPRKDVDGLANTNMGSLFWKPAQMSQTSRLVRSGDPSPPKCSPASPSPSSSLASASSVPSLLLPPSFKPCTPLAVMHCLRACFPQEASATQTKAFDASHGPERLNEALEALSSLVVEHDATPFLNGRRCVVVGASALVGLPTAADLVHAGGTVTIATRQSEDSLRELISDADVLVVAAGVPNLVKKEWIKRGSIVIDVGCHATGSSVRRFDGDVEKGAMHSASFITPVPGGVGPLTVAFLLYNTTKAWLGIGNGCQQLK